jgi:hypothetical protein
MVGNFVAEHENEYTTADKERELVRSKIIRSLSRECKNACIVTEQAIEDDKPIPLMS